MTSPDGALAAAEQLRPFVHEQQSTAKRWVRVGTVVLLVLAWVLDLLDVPPVPGLDPALASALDWSVLPWLIALVLLITGPEPRWATTWGWFWMIGLSPMVAVFLLVEPVPVWRTEPMEPFPGRLTGGRALLLTIGLGLVIGLVYVAVLQVVNG